MHEPALLRALSALRLACPRRAERAAGVLPRLLAPAGTNGNEWGHAAESRLTPTGFPVELAFTSAGDELRYVSEVGEGGLAAGQRLGLALERLAVLDPELSRTLDGAAWGRVQAMGELDFGAWIGVRHRSSGDGGDDFKLYLEVPSGAEADALRLLGLESPTANRRLMVGLTAASFELYFVLGALRPVDLPAILAPFGGDEDAARRLVGGLEGACGRFLSRLPGSSYAVSVSCSVGGGPPVFTLLALARDLFGSSADTRRALLDLGPLAGWDLEPYRRITRPLAAETGRDRHGYLGVTVRSEDPEPIYQIGLAPPDPPAVGQATSHVPNIHRTERKRAHLPC